jgi:transposase
MYTLRPLQVEEMATLKYERFCQENKIVSKRMQAIYHIATGHFNRQEIGSFLDVHADTIKDYIILFNQGGIPALKTVKSGVHQVSELEGYTDVILQDFTENPPKTSNEACQRIKELTDIERCPTQVRTFMKRHKLRYLKAGQIPAKANTEAQKDFLENTLNPLIDRAKLHEIHLLFMDSAHPVMSVFLCALWCVQRLFIKSSSGRKRLNILGAVNAITQNINFMTNETYINAETVIQFLYQLRIYYFDMKPIYIVLDNARYQHCDLVRYVAWQLNIHLTFLPTYSPNLNIIERLWKFLKKKTLYAKYYPTFKEFKGAIIANLNNANTLYQDELRSLLNLKFQNL